MNTVKKFKENQKKSIEVLNKLKHFLNEGDVLGAEIDPIFYQKIETAISDVNSDKLKIALIGGFSEGKTSIAAAWLEKLDKNTMKISEQESSNEVGIYEVDNEPIRLIDTPGLFGFKEKINDDTNAVEKYKDITKKYVSEAHFIFYVMNSKNPIKDSHTDELKWLFRDLNLLPRTIFILSRFDEVADIEDEQSYQNNLQIKKENILNRLNDSINLTSEEKNSLIITAVSANPFNLGSEKWLKDIDEFIKLSHIKSLQQATMKLMDKYELPTVIYETQKSVIGDIIGKYMPIVIEKNKKLADEIQILQNAKKRLSSEIKILAQNVKQAKDDLKENIILYFTGLIRRLKGCSVETLRDFLMTEIGDEGCILNSRIQGYFEEASSDVSIELNKIEMQVSNELEHYNSAVSILGKKGLNFAVKNVKFSNTAILAGRDFLKLPIKFKPWGALKLAKGLNTALVGIGFAMEIWDSIKSAKQAEAFEKGIETMSNNLSKQQKELLYFIGTPDFRIQIFPEYTQFIESQKEIENKLIEYENYKEKFEKWCEEGKVIKSNYKAIL